MRPLSGAEDGLLFLLFFGRGLFDLDIDLQFVLDLFGLIPDEAFGGPCAFREFGKGLGLAALFAGDVYAGGRPVPSAGYVLAVGILQDGEGLLFDGVSDAEVLAMCSESSSPARVMLSSILSTVLSTMFLNLSPSPMVIPRTVRRIRRDIKTGMSEDLTL